MNGPTSIPDDDPFGTKAVRREHLRPGSKHNIIAYLQQLWIRAVNPGTWPIHTLPDLGAHPAVDHGNRFVMSPKYQEDAFQVLLR